MCAIKIQNGLMAADTNLLLFPNENNLSIIFGMERINFVILKMRAAIKRTMEGDRHDWWKLFSLKKSPLVFHDQDENLKYLHGVLYLTRIERWKHFLLRMMLKKSWDRVPWPKG